MVGDKEMNDSKDRESILAAFKGSFLGIGYSEEKEKGEHTGDLELPGTTD